VKATNNNELAGGVMPASDGVAVLVVVLPVSAPIGVVWSAPLMRYMIPQQSESETSWKVKLEAATSLESAIFQYPFITKSPTVDRSRVKPLAAVTFTPVFTIM
jgi:hypothetical protein